MGDLLAGGHVVTELDPMAGYSIWLDREDWGHVLDGLILARDAAEKRAARNSESTSDDRARALGVLIRRIGERAQKLSEAPETMRP